MSTNTPNNILFVDSQVQNYQALVENLSPNTKVFILDPNSDGIVQISKILATQTAVDSVQIFSHGNLGMVQLGNTVLNSGNLQDYSAYLQGWRNSLNDNADVLWL